LNVIQLETIGPVHDSTALDVATVVEKCEKREPHNRPMNVTHVAGRHTWLNRHGDRVLRWSALNSVEKIEK
jgi:hypothetical protein